MIPEMTNKITTFFQERHEVIAVYVFGSYARGRERTESDLDLAILLDHSIVHDRGKLKTEYTIHLSRILNKDLHLIIMNDAGEEVIAQVFKYGKCVFNRRPELLSRFRMVSYAMIAEFGDLKKRMKELRIRLD